MRKLILIIIALLCASEVIAEGAKYLIIAPDSFVQALQPLADWKTKKGVKAMVVPLSVTGNTATQIKNYILNAYNNWQIRPEYILLAGLGTVLPVSGSSDDYYANMDTNYRIELSIGRFPCRTINQCQNIVAKTISYERTPYLEDTTWYLKGTTIVREDGALPDDSIYWNAARYVHNVWQTANYIHIDSFSRLQGHSPQNVEQAINNGRTYVTFRGQSVTSWWTPFNINIANINNGSKLPVIVTGCCPTMSLSAYGYLGDQIMNAGSIASPKGAVGYFATTQLAVGAYVATCRTKIIQGFFRSAFIDIVYRLGDATKRAKFLLDSTYHDQARYQEWNLFGDPELNLWTAVPKPLTVIYDSVITVRPTNVTVTVLSNGIPVSNALICLMKDTTIYEYRYTDSLGIKVFSISPQDTGTISITVTARNCHPFEGIIRVLPSGVEEIASLPLAMTSGFEVYPNPAKSIIRVRIPPSADRKTLKIFDVSGKQVKSEEVKGGNNRVLLNGIKDGVYFIKLGTETKKIVVNK